jgi:glycine/D-amino acid oxidase-like deaminating enzyme
MKLTSSVPFWFARNGLGKAYPFLEHDVSTEIAVIGAGVTGALIAHSLCKSGRKVIMLDSRDACCGSTSASTALLQYEIDVPLVEMAKMIGLDAAKEAYRVSHQSIDDLESIVSESNIDCDFRRSRSLYLAATRKQAKLLADEARIRKSIGLDVTYHDQLSTKEEFNLDGHALLSSHQAASCDPYQLAKGLIDRSIAMGAQLYDRTTIVKCLPESNHVKIETDRGPTLKAEHVVFANGFESSLWLKEKVVDLDNTYAIVSQPLNDLGTWDASWMLWEANSPYLYLRVTADHRLLAGGEDDSFHSPMLRERRLNRKANKIEQKVRALIPSLDFEVEHSWAGTFGKTRDGLAYIGQSPEYERCIFALGFGGNGITFSTIAAKLIPTILDGHASAQLELFRFGR